jgi:RNA exonuclease 4
MMQLMNAVLDTRQKKEKAADRHKKFKKRDAKFKIKETNKDDGEWNKVEDTRPISQKIFKPDQFAFKGETPVVAVDCEMVEVDRWSEGLARCSIVNYHGVVLMDKYVIPEGQSITNYRTWVSGVTPNHLKPENGAIPFKQAKQMAHKLLEGKIIVGHSIKHDFDVMELPETKTPKERIRDLIRFKRY